MPDIVCDTSPLEYLYQSHMLHLLPQLADNIIVLAAVLMRFQLGAPWEFRLLALSSLEWIQVRQPVNKKALLLINDMGPGGTEVLMLGLVLLGAKHTGHIPSIHPLLDQLQALRFRVSSQTRQALLELAGETT